MAGGARRVSCREGPTAEATRGRQEASVAQQEREDEEDAAARQRRLANNVLDGRLFVEAYLKAEKERREDTTHVRRRQTA